MTTQLQALQQAKEALIKGYKDGIYTPKQFAEALDALAALATVSDASPSPVYDDYAVDCFAQMMKEKLAMKRAEGRGGWNDPAQCSVEYLNRLLLDHVEKGDPVDVANFCMMLRHYGAKIITEPQKFDAWMANPYTKVLQKSVEEDYVPKSTVQTAPQEFEEWLRTVCFQAPTPEAYDLAKCAWQHRAVQAVPDDPSEIEELIACLGDDAAKLRQQDPDDEMAQIMEDAARKLRELDDALFCAAAPAPSVSAGGPPQGMPDLSYDMLSPDEMRRHVRTREQERCQHDYKSSPKLGGAICQKCGKIEPPPQSSAPSVSADAKDEFLVAAEAFAKAHIDCDEMKARADENSQAVSDDEYYAKAAAYNTTKASLLEAYHAAIAAQSNKGGAA